MVVEVRQFEGEVEINGKMQRANVVGRYPVPKTNAAGEVVGASAMVPVSFSAVGQAKVALRGAGGVAVGEQVVQFPVDLSGAKTPAEALAALPFAYGQAEKRATEEVQQRFMQAQLLGGAVGNVERPNGHRRF